MAHQTVQRIVRIIRTKNLLRPGDTVITGFSGGIDSTALLHILSTCNLGLRLVAVYIDHGLRPEETGAELLFTRQFAESLGVEYHDRKIPVREFQQQQGCSLEEAARILRYRALEDIRAGCHAQAIAVAHTADDQAEEFLLRMIRGSGLKGLSGMEYRRGHVVRPLLAESKNGLVAYLAEHRISFCHDSSNDDTAFLRNRVRHELLPELEAHYNPAIRATILQTTDILSQEEDLLENMAAELFATLCSVTPGVAQDDDALQAITCPRQRYATVHPALQRRVLEKICWKMGSRPSFRKLLQLQHLITDGAAGAKQHLANGLRVRIGAEEVYFSHPEGIRRWRGDGLRPDFAPQPLPTPGVYVFPEIGRQLTVQQLPPLDLGAVPPGTLVVDGARAAFPLVVRLPRPGEKMQPLGAPGNKKISRIYNDLKIPAELRPHHPIVAADKPVAILGLKIADEFKITEESTSVLLLSWKPITTAE